MSNIFLKNNLSEIFNSITESNISLPEWITIVDQTNTPTNKNNLSLSTTSPNIDQAGGAYSVTSNTNNIKDANQLISMLTSDSSSNTFKGLSETSTASLEQQLRDILKQDGGSRKNKLQKGGNGPNNIKPDDIKHFFMDLKSQGVNVDVKLNNLSLSEFFNNERLQTTTELDLTTEQPKPQTGGARRKSSKKSSKKKSQRGGSDGEQDGGAKRRKSKKVSKKKSQKGGSDGEQDGGAKRRKSKKSSKKSSQKGGVNESFQALIKLRKAIAEKLTIPNGVPAMKIASSLVKEIKEGNASMNTAQAAKQVMDKLKDDKYVDHARQMLK